MKISSHSTPPFVFSVLYSCKLLISLVALGDRTQKIWVRGEAETDHSQCYNDLYLSDQNGDGKVDSEEYVNFSRLRLKERLQLYPDGHTYDTSSVNISTFVLLPSGLQSNFYTLACLCSRFEFDESIADKIMCCVGENAHLSVVSTNDANGGMDDDELKYSNLLCTFTDRAIDDVISTMETIQFPPSSAPLQTNTNTINPAAAPTALSMTGAPITVAPTARPSLRTDAPTSMPSMQSTTISTSSMTAATLTPSFLTASDVQPTNMTVKVSYSILVQEKERMTVDYLSDIHDDCIEGMNVLATEIMFDLWLNGHSSLEMNGNIRLEESEFHKRFFVELPTSIDKIEEMEFISAPELVEIDTDFDSENALGDNDKIFVGGPCPNEMEYGKRRRKYNCFEVHASIPLRVRVDDKLIEDGITAEDIKDSYSDVLQQNILQGRLANIHEEVLEDSTVIMATGQIVSKKSNETPETEGPNSRVRLIVGLVTTALLLILLFFLVNFLRRRWQNRGTDEKDTVANPEEDLEARNSPSSRKSSVGNSLQPKAYQQQRSPNKSVPYFRNQTSPGSVPSADDTKSIGGVSAESDAGWSDVYTNSVGSVSDDGVGDLDSPPRSGSPGPPPMMSLSAGPSTLSINTEDSIVLSPMKDSRSPVNIIPVTPPKPSSPESKNLTSPVSPITPKSIQLLEEATSDNDDEILIHEDFSDEEVNDKDEHDESQNNSNNQQKESPEEFRSRIYDLIERIVPEEIDQIDDMIAEFKNREDELVETLLAMEKRTLAQWRKQKN